MNYENFTQATHDIFTDAAKIYGRVKTNMNNPFQLLQNNNSTDSVTADDNIEIENIENSTTTNSTKTTTSNWLKTGWTYIVSFISLFLFSLVYLSGPIWNKLIFCGVAVVLTEALLAFR